jgi:hypothetical protein
MPTTPPPQFSLRFPPADIPRLEAEYWATCKPEDKQRESYIETKIALDIRSQGFLTRDNFLTLCRWKSPRIVPYAARNDVEYIRTVTGCALATASERLRIEVLTLLAGTGWPIASVILHFGCDNLYPILDFRALWSAGVDDVSAVVYDFELWQAYTLFCRVTAQDAGVSLRVLDRAMWGYSAL